MMVPWKRDLVGRRGSAQLDLHQFASGCQQIEGIERGL
jgi:hypothetical protein